MPDFLQSVQSQDIGYLRIVAERWGIDLKSNTFDSLARELAANILDPQLCNELLASLNSEAETALNALVASGGRLPWTAFVREFGDVREMGAGKRDRDKPYLKPDSPAEVLYYRAILSRAFFDTEKGPLEYAYIPDELLQLLRTRQGTQSAVRPSERNDLGVSAISSPPLGRLATPAEKVHILLSTDRILDDATTMLAALRLGSDPRLDPFLLGLLHAAGLLKKNVPRAEKIKTFLEIPRLDALRVLVESWRKSVMIDELRLIPELVFEGEWANSPMHTRQALLGFMAPIPRNTWWSLNAFVSDIWHKQPDFQRPAGEYDSWFIRRKSDGEYLRGFACWDEVDGALIRFLITHVLYRLGLLDLARSEEGNSFTAFRFLVPFGRTSSNETGKLKISSGGTVTVPRSTPRAVRYQIARFCRSVDEKPEEYVYRLTPVSLTKAKDQGLKIEQLLSLLSKHTVAGVPPVLIKALKRWEAEGVIARVETQLILRVKKPDVLVQLRKSKAARFLGQSLGPTAIVIKPGAGSKVLSALAELGYIAEDSTVEVSADIPAKP